MLSDESYEELRRVLATRVRSEVTTSECLSDDRIAAFASGALANGLRAGVVSHLATCVRCRAAVASIARALTEPAVANAVAAADGGPRRFYRLAVPLAAAAVLLLLLRSPRSESGRHRGEDGVVGPVPVAPMGIVAGAPVLVWRRAPDADEYRVTLFVADGRVAFEARVRDSAVVLPDSVLLIPGRAYLWKVEARTGFDRWSTSALVEFSLGSPSP